MAYARFASLAAAPVALICCLSSCYYTKQAGYFLSERLGAEPTRRLADDPASPAELVAFLRLVEDVRAFASGELGLKETRNYTSYVALDRDYVADVVQACAGDSFERHYWRYPVLGDLPYKGFYERADAEAEARRLREAGLDVIVRKVDAFSSLGFFRDPLYSFMVGYEPDMVAELVFHESAHATLFVKGADQFNEEFATFVGRKAAELYCASRWGADSDILVRRAERRADGEAFVDFLQGTAALLEDVYGDPSLSRDEVQARKAAVIAERGDAYRQEASSLFHTGSYENFDMGSINNAYIDLYRLYEEDMSLYEAWYSGVASNSLPVFISSLRDLASDAKKDIKKAMTARLAFTSGS